MRGKHHHHLPSSTKADSSAVAASSGATSVLDGLSLIQRGNEYFFSDCYLEATGYYYQAAMLLKLSPEHKTERAKAWSNVAECHLRLQNWQAAEDAATNAIAADPSNTKALFRRAKARFELGNYTGASKDADAVGTQDAMDVAALCRELAHADVARKLTVGGAAAAAAKNSGSPRERRERRERRQPAAAEVRDPAPLLKTTESAEERELWFRRIIDSYRLRVDDEYTQTGASDAGCLYGIQAKGLQTVKSPMDHFQSYVNRAIKKRVLPNWFTVRDMEELCQMAANDPFSNINFPVTPEEMRSYYGEVRGPHHNELQELRDLAIYIEGPIGMPWKKGEEKIPEKPKPAATPKKGKIVLEPGMSLSSPSWANRHSSNIDGNRAVYDVSAKYPPGRPQADAYGRHSSGETSQPVAGYSSSQQRSSRDHSQHILPYSSTSEDRRENKPPFHHAAAQHQYQHHPAKKAPHSPKHTRFPRAPAHKPVTDKRNPMYPYHQDPRHGRRGERSFETQQQHYIHPGSGYSPKPKKREHHGWNHVPKQPHHHHGNRYGLLFSEEKRSPPPCPISDSDSTMSDFEQRSYGPQLPFNPSSTPGLPNTHSARMMMMSLMPSVESDDDETTEYEERRQLGEFYSQEETSTAQEVRHGLWRGDLRDEFSELTELSP